MNNAAHDKGRITKILTIRAKARRTTVEEMLRGECPICVRPAADGFFQADKRTGKAIMGCVDAHHAHAYRGLASERSRWFNRPEAQALRARELNSLSR